MSFRFLFPWILIASAVAAEPDDATTLRDQLNGKWTEVTVSLVAGCDCVGAIRNGIRLTRNTEGVAMFEYELFGSNEKQGRPAKLTSDDAKLVTDAILRHYTAGTLPSKGTGAKFSSRDGAPLQIAVHIKAEPLNDTWIRACSDIDAFTTWITKMRALVIVKR